MSASPINNTLLHFPRAHILPMTLSQVPSLNVNTATAAAHAAAQVQQRLVVADNTIAKRNATNAQKRANHNAIERARRECLNSKFQELARSIPSLSQVRRPSKSVIVQKSLDYIHTSKQRTESRNRQIRSIKDENLSLREEVDRLRQSLGMAPLPERPASPSPEPEELDTPSKFDAGHSSSYDSSSALESASSIASNSDLEQEQEQEQEQEDGGKEEKEDDKTELKQSPLGEKQPKITHINTPSYAAISPNNAHVMTPTTATHVPGFLNYMQADLSNSLNANFVTSSINFPAITQAVQAATGIDMYNSPLSLATTAAAAIAAVQASSPHQQIFLPSPCDDVFNLNGIMMNNCIDRPMDTLETLHIQTPPQ